MSKDYGLKIIKTGNNKDITSKDPRDYLMSSKFSMLKYHLDQIASVTFAPGDTEHFVDIQHMLPYTPSFIAYVKDLNGNLRFIPSINYPSGPNSWAYAYADSQKVRCGYKFGIGAYGQSQQTFSDIWDDFFSNSNFCVLGKKSGNSRNGALRFTNITVPQGTSITSAVIGFGINFEGSGTVHAKIFGIAEDNTASFSSNPMGRPQTTSFTTPGVTLPPVENYGNMDVTGPAQEIINRGGWSSGNAMGFLMFDNGSADGAWMEDDHGTGIESQLTITYGANVILTFRCVIFKNKIV